jgi:hypothetical protein
MIAKVNLTPHDRLPTILSKFAAAEGERVLLVVPVDLHINEAELLSLRRLAGRSRKALALVTTNPGIKAACGRAGISAFGTAEKAERSRWRRLPAEPDLSARPPTPATVTPPPGAGQHSPSSPTGFRPFSFQRAYARAASGWWDSLLLLIVLVLLMGGLLAALLKVVPSADIVLVPAAERLQATVHLTAIKDAYPDEKDGVVPAASLSAQVRGEARTATTGRRFEPSTKATGDVVLINRTSGQVTVPAGSIVSTATGNNVRFQTALEAPLLGGARATVPIEAVLPGPDGNVRAGTITRLEGPLALSVIASNERATAGGNVAQVGVVTEDDKERLQATLYESLRQKAYEALTEQLPASKFIPADSVVYLALSPTFTPFVGEVSEELSLSMSVQAVGLVVDARQGETSLSLVCRTQCRPGRA